MRAHRVQRVLESRYRCCTTPPLLCPFLLGAHGSILIHLTDPGAMRTSGDSAQAMRPRAAEQRRAVALFAGAHMSGNCFHIKHKKCKILCAEQQNGSREHGAHRHVEQSHGALRGKPSLYGGSKSEPDKTAREGDKDKQHAKEERLHDSTAGVGVQIGPHRAGADEPRLGVDPLKSGVVYSNSADYSSRPKTG